MSDQSWKRDLPVEFHNPIYEYAYGEFHSYGLAEVNAQCHELAFKLKTAINKLMWNSFHDGQQSAIKFKVVEQGIKQ